MQELVEFEKNLFWRCFRFKLSRSHPIDSIFTDGWKNWTATTIVLSSSFWEDGLFCVDVFLSDLCCLASDLSQENSFMAVSGFRELPFESFQFGGTRSKRLFGFSAFLEKLVQISCCYVRQFSFLSNFLIYRFYRCSYSWFGGKIPCYYELFCQFVVIFHQSFLEQNFYCCNLAFQSDGLTSMSWKFARPMVIGQQGHRNHELEKPKNFHLANALP